MTNYPSNKKKQIEDLEKDKNIQDILNEAYKILNNPIVMFDTSYNLLCFTENVLTDDPLWNEIIALHTFSHETVDFFNKEKIIKSFKESKTVTLIKNDKLKYERVNGKLFDKDDVQLANINIVSCFKAIEKEDLELIEILCNILSIKLQHSNLYQKIDRVYQESIFDKLITNTKIDENEMIELYNNLKANLYVAVVDTIQYEPTITHLAYFRDLFKKIQPEYKYYIHLNNILIIISTDNTTLSVNRDLKTLNEFFLRYGIYAGISSKFQNLNEIKNYYKEAINALNYGLKSTRKQSIFNYDNFRIEHFLSSIRDKSTLEKICSPIVYSILKYDMENNTSLLHTLSIYLLYVKDISKTIESIGINTEELFNRLRKLEELFEIDWKNGDMIYNIFISIKMLDGCA